MTVTLTCRHNGRRGRRCTLGLAPSSGWSAVPEKPTRAGLLGSPAPTDAPGATGDWCHWGLVRLGALR